MSAKHGCKLGSVGCQCVQSCRVSGLFHVVAVCVSIRVLAVIYSVCPFMSSLLSVFVHVVVSISAGKKLARLSRLLRVLIHEHSCGGCYLVPGSVLLYAAAGSVFFCVAAVSVAIHAVTVSGKISLEKKTRHF